MIRSRRATWLRLELTLDSSISASNRSLTVNGEVVKLQIWDTAGQERFRTITGAYYKGAHAIIIVYDITKKESFEDIDAFWLGEVHLKSIRSKSMHNLILLYFKLLTPFTSFFAVGFIFHNEIGATLC